MQETNSDDQDTARLKVGSGSTVREIAVIAHGGKNPGVMWLGGYRSDMSGTKALRMEEWARKNQLSSCRHDYSGHGQSGGEFRDGTVSLWLEESLAVFDQFTKGPQILVGSSMGAWVALRMVEELAKRSECDRLQGLLLLAPAPDFTHELMAPKLSEAQRNDLTEKGYLEVPTPYSDEPNIFTNSLFEDGKQNRVLTGPIDTRCPIYIIQGMKDDDVPFDLTMKLMSHLPNENVTLSTIKDGDHRLSREQDLTLMIKALETLREET